MSGYARCNVMMRFGPAEDWLPGILCASYFCDPTGLKTLEPTEFRFCTPEEIETELEKGGWRSVSMSDLHPKERGTA